MRWTYASTLSVEDGTLTLTQGPVGNVSSQQFACSALQDVKVETEAGGFGGRVRTGRNASLYALTLVVSRAESTQDVTVVDDLPYKPEAEWMADQILKATEQQDQ